MHLTIPFHEKLFTGSNDLVYYHGRKLYIWPFLFRIDTFGKWLRLSAKSLLSKTEKTQISEQTQIIWVRWRLWEGYRQKVTRFLNNPLLWSNTPLSDIFFGIHTILHDILGFDTIYHTIFGKKLTWNSRQMRKINKKAFLDA